MVTSARLVLISLLAGLLGRTKLVLCLRSQVVGRSRGSGALLEGRTSEQPTGDLDGPAATFRTATGEGEEQRQPRRRRRRRLQAMETPSPGIPVPTLSPVPTVSPEPALSYDYSDDYTAVMTASASNGNQPTVAPVEQVTLAPTPTITSIASPAAPPSSTVGATATAMPLGKGSTSLGPEEPPTLAPSMTPSSHHPITGKPLSPTPTPMATPTPTRMVSPSPMETEGGGGDGDDGYVSGTDTEYVTAPSENADPTPAPVVVSGVSTLKGLISVPTETLGKSTLFDLFGDYLALEDQDRVTIDAPSSRRRLREFEKLGGDGSDGGLLDLGEQGFVSFAIEVGKYKGREGLPPFSRDVGYYDGRGHQRALAEETTTTREFAVAFINDPGETAAFGRSLDAAVLLLSSNGTEVFARRLNTTEDSIVFSDVVFAAPASEDIATAAAESTFYGDDDLPSRTAIGLAAALMAVAVLATCCFGVALGKCWLVGERGRRARKRATMKQPPSQPAYEAHPQPLPAPPLSLSSKRLGRSGFGGTVSGGGGGSSSGASTLKNASRAFGGAVARDASMRAPSSSTVPRGGDGATAAAAAAASEGRDPLLEHDPENALRGSGRGFVRAERSTVSGGAEDLVEHVYGDAGHTESFADLIDGAFSEYEGQSEYDPVVPGGTSMTDGIMSDTGSSRFYFDDEHSSEWGTEEVGSQQDNGSLGGFPLRRGSSRFSTGPRSQASFAAPSVAASGRSALSSVVPPSSRANFPPSSGGGASPPLRQSDERGYLAGGILAGGARRIESRAAVAAVDTETEAIITAQAGGSGVEVEEDEKGDGSSGEEGETLDGYERDEERKALLQGHAGEEGGGRGEPGTEHQAGEGAAAASAAGVSISGASAAAAGGEAKGLEEKGGGSKAQVGSITVPALPSVFAAEAPPTPIPPPAPKGAVNAAETRVANEAVGAEDTADADAGPEAPGGDNFDVTRRPSLDSAAGSITLSSVVSAPRRGTGSGGGGRRIGLGVPHARGIRITSGGDGVVGGGGGGGGGDTYEDDDAESRYAGSSVTNESVRHEGRISGASSRPTRVMGSLSGGPTGRNSQSVGGMSMSGVESSHDSDRESFVSRVESCAFTDVGSGAQERAGLQGRAGQGTSGVSPTSTLMRSTGMSELGTERDSYGSDGYTNGSDSPGAQSGWERAWMRQRDDARHFGGR